MRQPNYQVMLYNILCHSKKGPKDFMHDYPNLKVYMSNYYGVEMNVIRDGRKLALYITITMKS